MKHFIKYVSILLAVILLICGATVFVLADEGVITREEFFNSIVKVLGFEKADSMSKSFSDTEKIDPEFYGNIAAGVNHGLFLGKTDGTLGPKDVLTVEDMEYVLSRIDFTPKTVTKYVSGGTKVVEKVVEVPVEVEKIVEVPVPQGCDEENGNHFFEFDATTGLYKCICRKKVAPAGTREIYKATDPYDFKVEGLDEQKLVSDVYFDPAYGIVMTEDGDLNVACNAKLYEMVEDELVPIGFLELFDKYRFDFDEWAPLYSVYLNIEEPYDETRVIDGLVVVDK